MSKAKFSVSRFVLSLAASSFKYVLIYSFILVVLLALPMRIDMAYWRDMLGELFDSGVFWLVLFMSFCVGWAGAVRKNESAVHPFPLLIIGALIAGLVATAVIATSMAADGPLGWAGVAVIWVWASFLIWLLISWTHFFLGFWGEFWW